MKPPRLALLVVSLLANAALGAWLLFPSSIPASGHPRNVGSASPRSTSPKSADTFAQTTSPATAALKPAAQSDADYAARLRQQGFPPHLIRALLTARVRARYTDKLNALRRGPRVDEYWCNSPYRFQPDSDLPAEARAKRRAINREIDEVVKTALGPSFEGDDPAAAAQRARSFGNISSEKAAQVSTMLTDYSELQRQISDRTQGVILPQDREQYRLLEAERRADLESLLTPAELLEYDLRSSSSANTVRNRIAFFDATEEEYRELTAIQLEFDRQYGSGYLTDAEQAKKRDAEKTLIDRARAVLKPERFAEYELANDPNYRNALGFLRGYNYDAPVAKQLVTLQRSITARAEAVRKQPLYEAAQRDAELAALYREASAQVSSTLSAKAYEDYTKQGSSRWLTGLQPKPTPAGKP